MTGTLTDAELTLQRTVAGDMLPGTCNVLTISRSPDSAGGWTEGTATVSGVACKLFPVSARNVTEGERFVAATGWVLSVKWDTALAAGNRVVYGSDTFEVLSVEDDHDWRVLRRAMLRRVDG